VGWRQPSRFVDLTITHKDDCVGAKVTRETKKAPTSLAVSVWGLLTCRFGELQSKNSDTYSVCGCSERQLRAAYS
jgi:hypothetical protein